MQDNTKQSSVMADINMTPMVDVMLVLLIIFMVVTPALMAGFNAKLPQGIHLEDRPDQGERTTLGIDREGRYYLNRQVIAREDAQQLLKAEFERHPDDRVLFLKADRSIRYGEVLAAMRLARTAGARVVAAVTEQSPPPASTRAGG